MTRLAPTLLAGIALLASPAAAHTVSVDFSHLAGTTDITVPASITLDGVTFTYMAPSGTADSSGVFGTPTTSVLILTFSAPVTQLSFDYRDNSSTQSGPVSDALIANFSNNDLRVIAGPLNQTLSFSYQGAPFDFADLLFALEADSFAVNTISYVPVPEPMPLLIFASGLLGLAAFRRRT